MKAKELIAPYISTLSRQNVNRRVVYSEKIRKLLSEYGLPDFTVAPPDLDKLSPTTQDGVASYKLFDGGCLRLVKMDTWHESKTCKFPVPIATSQNKDTLRYLVLELEDERNAKSLNQTFSNILEEEAILRIGVRILSNTALYKKVGTVSLPTKELLSELQQFVEALEGRNAYLAERVREELEKYKPGYRRDVSDTNTSSVGETDRDSVLS